jgi:hypothetical protein
MHDVMTQLSTRDELVRRKAIEQEDLMRPQQQALALERDLVAARAQCWELLGEFVKRAGELGVQPRTWQSSSRRGHIRRVAWIEGYPLANGAIVSVPPLRYCIQERRLVRGPRQEVRELEAVSLFARSTGPGSESAADYLEPQSASRGSWPNIHRLEHAADIIHALQGTLETSLLALMN